MERCTFGEFVVDLQTRELRRAGSRVVLSPKAFHLLAVLVERRPTALSKTELQDLLWPGTFVVEKNLTNLVGEIRAALEDDAARPRYIRTVPRFGYAFCGTEQANRLDADGRRHNLPALLTSFVGRRREIPELVRLVTSTRLLTLTGAGGCGKTRLALEMLKPLVDRVRDGVWMVDLGPLSDEGLVGHSVASALDVRPAPGRSLEESISDFVRDREIVLLLDNCEHLIAPCARLAETLLHAAPRLTIVATSREALGVAGEIVWRVPSLSLSDDAIELFLDRAAAVDPTFAGTRVDNLVVADVCQRLDGIPLAIELAAARLTVLSIEQIQARLNDRFRLLTGGSRTAVARQRTLEATVDWSYELLAEPERRLLCRLSVFSGGWTLDAAEAVCEGNGIDRGDILDLLSRLADKSLASVDHEAGGQRRYRFLETVRQYGRERLLQSGDTAVTRDRHAAYFLDLARLAEPEMVRARQVAWLNRLQLEHENLRSALEWNLTAPGGTGRCLEMATTLLWFWLKRAHFAEGQRWLQRGHAACPHPPEPLHAKSLLALGFMLFFQADFEGTHSVLKESATRARASDQGSVLAMALGIDAMAALESGDMETVARLSAEGLAASRSCEDPLSACPSLSCFAYVALHQGDLEDAGRLHEQVLELLRRQGEKWAMGIVLYDLAFLRVIQGRHAEARAFCAEALTLCRELGDRRGIAFCFGIAAAADAAENQPHRAARLRGAMDALLEAVGAPMQPTYNTWIGDRAFEGVKQTLGADAYLAALNDGRAMSLTEAVEFVFDETEEV
jgi:non-specific serine/threonine protein kinase